MSEEFEKLGNRVQLLEQENHKLHDQVEFLNSNKQEQESKYLNGHSFIEQKEVIDDLVSEVSRKALSKTQDELWNSVNFFRDCLRFIGVTSALAVVVGFVFFVFQLFNIHDKANEITEKVVTELLNPTVIQEKLQTALNEPNFFVIAGQSLNREQLKQQYQGAKDRSGKGGFGFGEDQNQVAKICQTTNPDFPYVLVLTLTKNNKDGGVAPVNFESALKIQQQALADNFTPSDIQIVGKNYQDPNRFNSVDNSQQCEPLP